MRSPAIDALSKVERVILVLEQTIWLFFQPAQYSGSFRFEH